METTPKATAPVAQQCGSCYGSGTKCPCGMHWCAYCTGPRCPGCGEEPPCRHGIKRDTYRDDCNRELHERMAHDEARLEDTRFDWSF